MHLKPSLQLLSTPGQICHLPPHSCGSPTGAWLPPHQARPPNPTAPSAHLDPCPSPRKRCLPALTDDPQLGPSPVLSSAPQRHLWTRVVPPKLSPATVPGRPSPRFPQPEARRHVAVPCAALSIKTLGFTSQVALGPTCLKATAWPRPLFLCVGPTGPRPTFHLAPPSTRGLCTLHPACLHPTPPLAEPACRSSAQWLCSSAQISPGGFLSPCAQAGTAVHPSRLSGSRAVCALPCSGGTEHNSSAMGEIKEASNGTGPAQKGPGTQEGGCLRSPHLP